jgi:hypothetical protein
MLDLFEEHHNLSAGEFCLRRLCMDRLVLLVLEKAARWKQRGKFRAIREGDANTRFFQACACTRLQRNHISMIEADGETYCSHEGKVFVLTGFYRQLLAAKMQFPGVLMWATCTAPHRE